MAGWVCFLAVTTLTSGSALHADDATASVPSNRAKLVALPEGGAIKVQDTPDPGRNLRVPPPSDKYDPRSFSMNQTSSLANKSFSADSITPSKSGSSLVRDQAAFSAKPFTNFTQADTTTQTAKTKYSTSGNGDYNRSNSLFDKNFGTSDAAMGHDASKSFSKTSTEQGRTSSLSGKTSETHTSDLAKQYLGPGAQHVPDGLVKENVVIGSVNEIPNRPLTIDEVRGLINHGFKADTKNAPSESSKPMNDPNYVPEASPEPPDRVSPVPAAPDDDKSGALPSPGTLAQPPPENSTPLPQH